MSFPAYVDCQDSGLESLGYVPSHWSMKRLKDVASHNDEALGDNTPEDAEFFYVDISSVNTEQGIHTKEEVVFRDAPSRARRCVQNGDVIVSTVRTYLKAISRVVDPEENLIVSTGFAVIRPREELDTNFAGNLLLSQYFIDEVISRSTGVSYPAINASDLVRIKVPVPPLNEQKAIASFLDVETSTIDDLVSKQHRLIELLKEKRQAVISHAVTKSLNPDAPMKSSGVEWLGDVPRHWGLGRLKHLVTTRKGIAFKADDFVDEGVDVVKASDIKKLSIRTPSTFLPSDSISDYPKAVLNANELVLSTVGSTPEVRNSAVGQLGRVPIELAGSLLNQNTVVFTPNEDILSNEYLYFLIQTTGYRDHLDLHAHGTANQVSLNVSDMLNIHIPLPPPLEQAEIAKHLDRKMSEGAALSAEAERAIELLQERRAALISAAVTGKIDVRDSVLGKTA